MQNQIQNAIAEFFGADQGNNLTTEEPVTSVMTIADIANENAFDEISKIIGEKGFLFFEQALFALARKMIVGYEGGYYDAKKVSNGAFYYSLKDDDAQHMVNSMNYADETISADAAGLVLSIFALSWLMSKDEEDTSIEAYRNLVDFAYYHHSEKEAIRRLCD